MCRCMLCGRLTDVFMPWSDGETAAGDGTDEERSVGTKRRTGSGSERPGTEGNGMRKKRCVTQMS